MTGLTPELAGLLAASTGVGLLMVVAGVQKSLLEWRRPRRQCPVCGRRIERRVCDCASPH
jgi:hypothetical protein